MADLDPRLTAGQQTAKATQDTAAQISEIQRATIQAVEAISGIGRTIEQVSAIASNIAAAVKRQGSATSEIARSVQQTAASTSSVPNTICCVSLSATDTGTAAEKMLSGARGLSTQTEEIAVEVRRFMAGMRAA